MAYLLYSATDETILYKDIIFHTVVLVARAFKWSMVVESTEEILKKYNRRKRA